MTSGLLTPEQRPRVEILAREAAPDWARRARLLLHVDDGSPVREAARQTGISRGTARYWLRRFSLMGMQMFAEASPEAPQSVETPRQEVLLLSTPGTPAETPVTAGDGTPDLLEFMEEAKTRRSPGVLPDDPLSEAGRKVWRYHFALMLLNESGTRLGEDIEALHDMRVATRRMRAAFEVFGEAFTPKALKPHLKGLRATGRALGAVRDLDVFMEKAQHYLDSLPEEQRGGLQPLLDAWQAQRVTARARMEAYLNTAKYRDFTGKFYKFLSTPGEGARALPQDQPTPSLVRELAPVLIYNRLAAVRAYDAWLQNATVEQFHALRIEFKKLRYTVEYFREVLGEEAKSVINEIKTLQDHLGDLNDAQVATQILRDFLARWDEQQAPLPVQERLSPDAVMEYLSSRYRERQRLMVTFRAAWERFNRPEMRQNIARAVEVL